MGKRLPSDHEQLIFFSSKIFPYCPVSVQEAVTTSRIVNKNVFYSSAKGSDLIHLALLLPIYSASWEQSPTFYSAGQAYS